MYFWKRAKGGEEVISELKMLDILLFKRFLDALASLEPTQVGGSVGRSVIVSNLSQ